MGILLKLALLLCSPRPRTISQPRCLALAEFLLISLLLTYSNKLKYISCKSIMSHIITINYNNNSSRHHKCYRNTRRLSRLSFSPSFT